MNSSGANPKYRKLILYGIFVILFSGIIAFFDKVLAVGIIFVVFLALVTFLAIAKNKKYFKVLSLLFLIVLLTHFGAVLFVHYANFQPFGDSGGDFIEYDYNAKEVAKAIREGNFSLKGVVGLYDRPISTWSHYFPVLVGGIYAFTVPDMLIGQLFNAWLTALIVIVTYLTVIEIGGSNKGAFLVGLLVTFYPSLLFFGSLLLKDPLVVLLALTGLLLTIKLIKNFSWGKFIIFYLALAGLFHFRFYIGYAVAFTFIFCLLLFSNLALRKRLVYMIIIIPLLGFLPQICANQGYGGLKTFQDFLNPRVVTYYKEVVYAPSTSGPSTPEPSVPEPSTTKTQAPPGQNVGFSFAIKAGFDNPFTFLVNYFKSFLYTLFGPFPWQIKYKRHLFTLLETIPWYFLFFFIVKGAIRSFKRNKFIFPLIISSLIILGVLSLFISNFGIITRIRIPAFIALLCFIPFSLSEESLIYKIYGKIFSYWGGRIYRLKPR